MGIRGLYGLDADEWYRNIITDEIAYTADELLEYAFPKLIRQYSGKLPLNKYLMQAKEDHPECIKIAHEQDFEHIISVTIKKNRHCLGDYTTVKQIWDNEKSLLERVTRLIAYLPKELIDVDELGQLLVKLFRDNENILQSSQSSIRTNVRRLILIYDYLKWGK